MRTTGLTKGIGQSSGVKYLTTAALPAYVREWQREHADAWAALIERANDCAVNGEAFSIARELCEMSAEHDISPIGARGFTRRNYCRSLLALIVEAVPEVAPLIERVPSDDTCLDARTTHISAGTRSSSSME